MFTLCMSADFEIITAVNVKVHNLFFHDITENNLLIFLPSIT